MVGVLWVFLPNHYAGTIDKGLRESIAGDAHGPNDHIIDSSNSGSWGHDGYSL